MLRNAAKCIGPVTYTDNHRVFRTFVCHSPKTGMQKCFDQKDIAGNYESVNISPTINILPG